MALIALHIVLPMGAFAVGARRLRLSSFLLISRPMVCSWQVLNLSL